MEVWQETFHWCSAVNPNSQVVTPFSSLIKRVWPQHCWGRTQSYNLTPPPTTLFALQKETQRFFMSCGDGLQPWRTCLEPRCGCSYRVVRSVMAPKHTAGWSMANESLPERRKTPPILKTLLNLSSGHFNGERASDVLPSFCAFPIWKREAPAVTMKAGAVNGRRESLPGKKMFSLSIIQLRSSYQC